MISDILDNADRLKEDVEPLLLQSLKEQFKKNPAAMKKIARNEIDAKNISMCLLNTRSNHRLQWAWNRPLTNLQSDIQAIEVYKDNQIEMTPFGKLLKVKSTAATDPLALTTDEPNVNAMKSNALYLELNNAIFTKAKKEYSATEYTIDTASTKDELATTTDIAVAKNRFELDQTILLNPLHMLKDMKNIKKTIQATTQLTHIVTELDKGGWKAKYIGSNLSATTLTITMRAAFDLTSIIE
jgi:hypothetical protein